MKDNFFRNIRLVRCEILSKEDEQEMYKILEYVEDKFGRDVFNQLTAIKVQRVDDMFIRGTLRRRGAAYKSNEQAIIINVTYFNSEADKRITNKVVGKFRNVIMHEIANYLFDTKNLLLKMLKVYIDSKGYVEKRYNSDYIKTFSCDERLSEIFAQAFCDFSDGTLDNKNNSLFDFIQSLEV